MRRAITFLAFVTSSAQLWAQQPPSPKPTDAHKMLADSAGTWDAVVKMYFRGPKGPPTESNGVETSEMVSGGFYSLTKFKYKMRDQDFEGHGLFGYDPRTSEYVGTWVDNFTTVPQQMRGKYDADQKTLTMFGTVVDDAGNEIKQKQVTKFIDSNTKTLQIFMIVEADGKSREIKLMELTAKKRS
jgi:Protein of unknown function (DUF1579)